MYFFCLFLYYAIFNVVFLLPLAFLIVLLRGVVEFFLGASQVTDGLSVVGLVGVVGVFLGNLWLAHRAAYIMTTETETFDGAIKAAIIETWGFIKWTFLSRD